MGLVPILGLILLSGGSSREIVALPLQTEGVPAAAGLDAWKAVKAELKRSRRKLSMSTEAQEKRHNLLIGPAREQARDCGLAIKCLTEIGSAVGAGVLVAGRVEKEGVILVAIDVREARLLKQTRSDRKLAEKDVVEQARSAARRLSWALTTPSRRSPSAAIARAERRRSADRHREGPEDRENLEKDDGTGSSVTPTASSERRSKPLRRPRSAEEAHTPAIAGSQSDRTREGAEPTGSGSSASDAKTDDGLATVVVTPGAIGSMSRVTVDGVEIPIGADGVATWKGPPGAHSFAVQLVDGRSVSESLVLAPDEERRVAIDATRLALPTPAPAPAVAPSDTGRGGPEAADGSVTSTWWFWTVVGLVAATGATSAVILARQASGGPDIPAATGTITGTY